MSSVGADVTPTGWTSSRTALLVAHYQTGLSAAESARRIGAVSKNAVISKRRRLELVAMADVGRVAGACWADDARQRPRFGAGRVPLFRAPPPMPTEPLPKMDGPPPPDANPRRLTERRFGECAWPLGPAEGPGAHSTLFCGAPAAVGASYCGAHAALAYRARP
jgi:hypothetical protein